MPIGELFERLRWTDHLEQCLAHMRPFETLVFVLVYISIRISISFRIRIRITTNKALRIQNKDT